MTSEQLSNAQIIIATGLQAGANAKQLLAAIEAALVESSLRNLSYGDRDSLGLFQQRPSQGWGSPSQILNPSYAAQAFFLGAGSNKGALAVSQSGTAGQLAQRVQRSAFPARYDQRQSEALSILNQSGVSDATSGGVWDASGGWDETARIEGDGAGEVIGLGAGAVIGITLGAVVLYLALSD